VTRPRFDILRHRWPPTCAPSVPPAPPPASCPPSPPASCPSPRACAGGLIYGEVLVNRVVPRYCGGGLQMVTVFSRKVVVPDFHAPCGLRVVGLVMVDSGWTLLRACPPSPSRFVEKG